MPVVRIPTVLRKHTAGEAKVSAPGDTVGEVLHALVATYPGLDEQIFDGSDVRGFINVYVDDEDIRYLEGLATPVDDDGEIAIMPAVAGGAEPAVAGEHARRHRVAGGAEPAVAGEGL